MSIASRRRNKGSLKDRSKAINRLVGSRIRALRLKLGTGFSQQDLGDKVGRSLSQISRIEGGDTAADPPLLIAIARAVGVKPSELIDGIDL